MCGEAVHACLPALKFVPDWFVLNKMLEKLRSASFSNSDIDLNKINSDVIIFFSGCMDLVTIDLNKINIDDDNFDEDNPKSIVPFKLMAWRNRYKQRKAC